MLLVQICSRRKNVFRHLLGSSHFLNAIRDFLVFQIQPDIQTLLKIFLCFSLLFRVLLAFNNFFLLFSLTEIDILGLNAAVQMPLLNGCQQSTHFLMAANNQHIEERELTRLDVDHPACNVASRCGNASLYKQSRLVGLVLVFSLLA